MIPASSYRIPTPQVRVLRQLQYSGLLELVRIRRQGWPSRMPFAEFESRYKVLLIAEQRSAAAGVGTAEAEAEADAPVEAETEVAVRAEVAGCLAILESASLHEHRHYTFGKTLIFLRNGVEGLLQQAAAQVLMPVLWLQKTARMHGARRAYAQLRDNARREAEERRLADAKKPAWQREAEARRRAKVEAAAGAFGSTGRMPASPSGPGSGEAGTAVTPAAAADVPAWKAALVARKAARQVATPESPTSAAASTTAEEPAWKREMAAKKAAKLAALSGERSRLRERGGRGAPGGRIRHCGWIRRSCAYSYWGRRA